MLVPKSVVLFRLDNNFNFMFHFVCLEISIEPGLQKDRDRGTKGPKEGLSPIGRFG